MAKIYSQVPRPTVYRWFEEFGQNSDKFGQIRTTDAQSGSEGEAPSTPAPFLFHDTEVLPRRLSRISPQFRQNSVRIPSNVMILVQSGSEFRQNPTPRPKNSNKIPRNSHSEGLLIAWRNLEAIRDERLYRSTHKTFEEYCRDVWGLSKRLANYQIQASRVVENLCTNSTQNILPTTESQARPLAPLPPDQQVEVWEKAVEIAPDSKPTARDVEIAKGNVCGRCRKTLSPSTAKHYPFLV